MTPKTIIIVLCGILCGIGKIGSLFMKTEIQEAKWEIIGNIWMAAMFIIIAMD